MSQNKAQGYLEIQKYSTPTTLNLQCLASNQRLLGMQKGRKAWPIVRIIETDLGLTQMLA